MAAANAGTKRRRPQNAVADLYAKLGRRLGTRLFNEVMAGDALRPRLTGPKVAAVVLATLVHGLTLAAMVAGVLLIVTWSGAGTVAIGVLCLVLAWLVRPRLGKAPSRVERRQAIPATSELVDRVSTAVGARRIDGVVVDEAFNASIQTVGWRRRTYLTIGLPLFEILEPEERVALLAHEAGHLVNGDPRRTGYVGSAINTVVTWHSLVMPSGLRRRGAGGVGAVVELAETIAELLLAGVAAILRWFVRGFLQLVWYESQRAEYLADDMARRVAGTRACVGMLTKFPLGTVYRESVQSTTLASPSQGAEAPSLFGAFRELARARLAQSAGVESAAGEREVRLDATHPPTRYRIAFMEARDEPGTLALAPVESDRIDREMEPIELRVQKDITERYRASLYRGG